jgi:tetratricopeptide (TPR) repeat protein
MLNKEFEEAAQYYVAALALSQQDDERFVNDRALYNYGLVFSTMDRYATAIERLEKQLVKNKKEENRPGEIATLTGLGEVYLDWRKYPLAQEFFGKALAIAESEGDYTSQCESLNHIGKTLVKTEDYEAAYNYFFRSWDIGQDHDIHKCSSDAYIGLGQIWEKREKKERAEANYLLALVTSRDANYSDGEEIALEALGKFFMNQNDNSQALSYLIPVLELKQDVVDQQGSARIWHYIGDVFFIMGKYLPAQRAYTESFRIRFDIKTFYECSVLLRKLGRVYRKMGKVKAALYYYTRSQMFFRTLGYLTGESRTRLEIAQFYADQEELGAAIDQTRQGLKITTDTQDRAGERDFRQYLAKLYRRTGKTKQAIKQMRWVMEIDEEIESDHTIEDARFLKELLDEM